MQKNNLSAYEKEEGKPVSVEVTDDLYDSE